MVKSFTTYELNEKLIILGGKAYPKFGQAVIIAGGSGSGKGFVYNNLIGLEGKKLDVDFLKTFALKSEVIKQRLKKELNIDITSLSDLSNPENTSKMHDIIGKYLELPDKRMAALGNSILFARPDRKPNVIFDVTLSKLDKFESITTYLKSMGYYARNIHLVWIINDINVAVAQNIERGKSDRSVNMDILINTHRGASQTVGDILNMGKSLSRYMDGDIVFAFNKVGVDTSVEKSSTGGMYIKDASYFYVKHAGSTPLSISEIDFDIRQKIQDYVPPQIQWV